MTATQTSPVEKLTDEAIKKRIAAITRLVKTRIENKAELQAEIDDLLSERTTLIQAQIDRLTAQLEPEKEQE
jgi:uncharacterized small protein (DUF1192 family)